MFRERATGPVKRVGFGGGDTDDILVGLEPFLAVLAVAHIVALLPMRIGADDQKIIARAEILCATPAGITTTSPAARVRVMPCSPPKQTSARPPQIARTSWDVL